MPDPLLAEGSPAVPYPQKGRNGIRASTLWEDSARIELAFRTYIHRDVDQKRLAEHEAKEKKKREKEKREHVGTDYHPESKGVEVAKKSEMPGAPEHIFEIIVCHCNVIRYFVMRALQLPPEAWLRLGGYNTAITELSIRPNGNVTLVRFGETGHLPIESTSFH